MASRRRVGGREGVSERGGRRRGIREREEVSAEGGIDLTGERIPGLTK